MMLALLSLGIASETRTTEPTGGSIKLNLRQPWGGWAARHTGMWAAEPRLGWVQTSVRQKTDQGKGGNGEGERRKRGVTLVVKHCELHSSKLFESAFTRIQGAPPKRATGVG